MRRPSPVMVSSSMTIERPLPHTMCRPTRQCSPWWCRSRRHRRHPRHQWLRCRRHALLSPLVSSSSKVSVLTTCPRCRCACARALMICVRMDTPGPPARPHILHTQCASVRLLAQTDWLTKSDPYLRLLSGNEERKTSHKVQTLNPVWRDEECVFFGQASVLRRQGMKLLLADKDWFTADDAVHRHGYKPCSSPLLSSPLHGFALLSLPLLCLSFLFLSRLFPLPLFCLGTAPPVPPPLPPSSAPSLSCLGPALLSCLALSDRPPEDPCGFPRG